MLLNANTFLTLQEGLGVIKNNVSHVLYGTDDTGKVRLTTRIGALETLDRIEQVIKTLREVIAHDTDVKQSSLLVRLMGRS